MGNNKKKEYTKVKSNGNVFYFDEITDCLGKGSFGSVYKAKDQNGDIFAIKKMSKKKLRDSGKETSILNEINSLISCNQNPNIISYYADIQTGNNYYIVTELCEEGNLLEKINMKDKTS